MVRTEGTRREEGISFISRSGRFCRPWPDLGWESCWLVCSYPSCPLIVKIWFRGMCNFQWFRKMQDMGESTQITCLDLLKSQPSPPFPSHPPGFRATGPGRCGVQRGAAPRGASARNEVLDHWTNPGRFEEPWRPWPHGVVEVPEVLVVVIF